jgi:hypothetical protein
MNKQTEKPPATSKAKAEAGPNSFDGCLPDVNVKDGRRGDTALALAASKTLTLDREQQCLAMEQSRRTAPSCNPACSRIT